MRHVLWLVVVLGLLIAGPLQAQVSQPDPTPEEIAACEANGNIWHRSAAHPEGICIPDFARRCAEKGGTWQRICITQTLTCVLPYPDAGKPCNDSSECKGGCLASTSITKLAVGECKGTNDPCGCFSWVEKGRVVQGPCFD